MKITITKTIKNFVGGKFVRTESGRSFQSFLKDGVTHYAHLCLSSRKDIRETVEAAHAGQSDWSKRSAFNRSQILYRMAEMTEGKRLEFVDLFAKTLGWSEQKSNSAVDEAIHSFVYYAGFCDKFAQLTSTMNPINGPFGNFTSPEPVGVVGLFPEKKFDLGRLTAQISSLICSGNAVIVILAKESECPAVIAPLSEVFATSDLPGGVINLLTGENKELQEVMFTHRDIRSLSYQLDDPQGLAKLQELSVDNLKRVIQPRAEVLGLAPIIDAVEFKTVWQPVGF